jgi:tetratricopeptide (TPR) repeat protein
VYSLGVVLFELQAGGLPHDLAGLTIVEATRIIESVVPRRARELNPSVPPDLDRIIAKSLAQDREQRYASAAELSADLARYLRDQPISARPPSVVYQLRKFAKRNKTVVIAAALILLTLVGGVIAERRRANQADSARIQAKAAQEYAELEAARANRVLDFVSNMFNKVTPNESNGQAVTVQQVLDTVAGDIDRELTDSPMIDATIRWIIGKTYSYQGLYPQAKAMLARAASIHEALGFRTMETAQILTRLGVAHRQLREFDAALVAYDRALPIAQKIEGPMGDFVLKIQTARSEVLYKQGRVAETAETLRGILDIRLQHYGEDNAETQVMRSNLANVLAQLGRFDEATELVRLALPWYVQNMGDTHTRTLVLRETMAGLEFERGNVEESFTAWRQLIADCRKHFGPAHPRLAQALDSFGERLMHSGSYVEAETLFREALDIYERSFGADHAANGEILANLAPCLRAQGELTEALAVEERAIQLLESNAQTGSVHYGMILESHAETLMQSTRCREAVGLQRLALERFQQLFGEDHARTRAARENLSRWESECPTSP